MDLNHGPLTFKNTYHPRFQSSRILTEFREFKNRCTPLEGGLGVIRCQKQNALTTEPRNLGKPYRRHDYKRVGTIKMYFVPGQNILKKMHPASIAMRPDTLHTAKLAHATH